MIDFNLLLKEREKTKRLLKKYENKLLLIEQKITENCSHEEKKNEKEYVEGGYLNVSESITITKCVICNKELDRKVKYGTYA